MTPLLPRLAIAVVRAWTRLYTWRLPAALRDARRGEIESDLWESEQDVEAGRHASFAVHVMARMLAGIPDDLAWRSEHAVATSAQRVRVAITGAAAGLLAAWFAIGSLASQLPAPPEAPQFTARIIPAPPPPPPPPPPPDPRASAGGRGSRVAVEHAETSYSVTGSPRPRNRIEYVAPVYPPLARTAGIGGDVVIEATIDEYGRVVDARIVQSIPMLDQSTIDAVQRWRFEPAARTGAPVRMPITVTATFAPQASRRAR